jgi:hypothetical protein
MLEEVDTCLTFLDLSQVREPLSSLSPVRSETTSGDVLAIMPALFDRSTAASAASRNYLTVAGTVADRLLSAQA